MELLGSEGQPPWTPRLLLRVAAGFLDPAILLHTSVAPPLSEKLNMAAETDKFLLASLLCVSTEQLVLQVHEMSVTKQNRNVVGQV